MLEKGYRYLSAPAIAKAEEVMAVGTDRANHRRVCDLLNPGREDKVTLDHLRRVFGVA